MKRLAGLGFFLLIIFVLSIYLPMIYGKVFIKKIEKTHLFYSPVSRDFILREQFTKPVPGQGLKKGMGHHTKIAYQKADKSFITRRDFEKHLPFIYYKNMELWGLLPIEINGQVFDKNTIKKNRRVLELKSRDITDQGPLTPIWPLLESNPVRARLAFPDDRFRMTYDAMEFINADTNKIDKILTEKFTRALTEKGFVFPARSVNGKFTILKPFDEGIFIVDAEFHVFHVKRVNGNPFVIKTPIDPNLQTRHIKISENRQKLYYGLLLTKSGQIYLLSYNQYQLIPLSLEHYQPDLMNLKLIFNPIFCTAVYSDQSIIRAKVLDQNFNPVAQFSHTMSRAETSLAKQVFSAIFPFAIYFDTKENRFLSFHIKSGGRQALIGLTFFLGLHLLWTIFYKKSKLQPLETGIVALTGIYGLIAVNFIDLASE